MKAWKIILIGVGVLIVGIGGYVLTHSGLGVDRSNLPRFIQADFVDLSKIYSISKFRSGEGHDFSGNGETCRSMKHYFTPQYDASVTFTKDADGRGLPPPPDGQTDIPIYSPVDGRITSVSEEHTPIGKQIAIQPSQASQFKIRLFHVYPVEGIGLGAKVKAGQKIGVIGANQGTDIAIQIGGMPWNENFISYFEVMPDSVFAAYEARGAKSRDDFILSKEYRDAHPLQCNGEEFQYPADYDRTQDDVHLSGYVAPVQSGQGNNNTAAAVTVDVDTMKDNQSVSAKVGDVILLVSKKQIWYVGVNSYDTMLLKDVSPPGLYQYERKLSALKAGTTTTSVVLTPSCYVPKDNQPACATPSQQLTLTITIQ